MCVRKRSGRVTTSSASTNQVLLKSSFPSSFSDNFTEFGISSTHTASDSFRFYFFCLLQFFIDSLTNPLDPYLLLWIVGKCSSASKLKENILDRMYHIDLVVMVVVMVEMEKSEESIMRSKSTVRWTVPNKHRRLCSQKRLWRWLVCCCAAAPFRSLLSCTGSVTLSTSHGLHTHLNLDKMAMEKGRRLRFPNSSIAVSRHNKRQRSDRAFFSVIVLFSFYFLHFFFFSSTIFLSILLRRRHWRRRLLRSLFFTMSWSLCASRFLLPSACC